MWQFKKQILIYILACRLPFFPRDVNKNLCSLAEPHPILSKDSERRGQSRIYLNYAEPHPILFKGTKKNKELYCFLKNLIGVRNRIGPGYAGTGKVA
jgi:hypothetical protein